MRLNPTPTLMIVSALLSFLPGLHAETWELREGENGYTGATSTFTHPIWADYSHGGSPYIRVSDDGTHRYYGFLRWDLSSIEGPLSVQNATITLSVGGAVERDTESYSYSYNLYAVVRPDLYYGNGDSVLQNGTVTQAWSSYDADPALRVGWGASGMTNTGPVAGEDYSLTLAGKLHLTQANTNYSTVVITLDTALVQSWINNPSTNYGFIITSDFGTLDVAPLVFDSHHHATLSARPMLTLNASQVPEPGVGLAFGIGIGCLLLWRHQRH